MSGIQWGLVLLPVVSLLMGIVIGRVVGWVVGVDDERKRLAPWRGAVLDALANTCMDAPMDEPPANILARVIAWHVETALDPKVSDVVNYSMVYDFAYDNCLDYNQLCQMICTAIESRHD